MKPDSKYMTLEDLRKKQQSDPRYMSAADLNARLEDKKRKEEERVRKEEERVRKEQEKLEIQEKQKPTARYEDPKDPISNYQKSLNAIDEINKSLGISTPKKTMPFKRDEKIHSDLDTTPEERKLEFKPEEKSTKTYSEPEEYTEPKPFSKATAVAAKIGAEYMVGFEKGINTLVDFGFGIMANAARTFGKDDKAELYDMARAYVYESKYKQASRELDDFLSPKAREGHLLQKASQFTGELAGLVTFSFLGDKATEGLFKVFSGGSTGAAISTLTENAATGTAQQVANKTGKIVTRVGGAAARYLYTRGSNMSELLEKGYTYDEAAKVANIYSGISAGLDLTTNVVYGAFSTTLLKDFTDKTVVNGTEIIIQELTKKEMITSELLRTLKVGNVEALKGVARSATKNELERMILDPTKLGYFKNENGEISLTRAGQDYLVNFVISSIVQTPGRIKNIEAFDKYQSQLMTDTAKQVDLSKASRIEISKSVKKGDSVKASPIVRTPENEQFLNSILDAAKKDGIDLTEGMNIGDGVDIVYDPDLRYEIVRTDGTKIEVHGGFKYVFEKDYHVNIQQEKNDVPKISVKKKSTDVGADYIKITNDIVSSDNPVDVKVNLLEHQISGLNNVLVSNIKITPKLMKDVYTNKQTLIKAKEELLSKASDTELNIIYAGSKAAEYSAKTAPDSDNKAQIIDEIQKEKENVATLLDKDRDIKLITNKATVEKEFTENTTGAIDILNKLNENRPENDKIKFVQDYTEDQQLAVDVGSAFGKQVFFIENSNFSGFTVDTNPNVLFIDSKPVNALIKDQNSAFTYVVGHELFHSLKEVDPVTYNSFMRYIYTEVNAEQVLNFIDKYDPTATLNTINALKIDGKLNMDELIKNPHEYLPQTSKLLEIVEEMAANEFGNILTTPDFWIGMNNKDSKVAERLSDIASRMIDKINEPVYDSPLTQVQVDRIKNKFLDIISGIEEKEIEKVAKPKLPVKKEVDPPKIEVKETVSEPIKVKEEPVRKLPVKKVESKKVTPKKEVVSEPVTKTVSKIAEKATGKKPNKTVKSNTIKRISEQRSATTKRMELTKYYEGKDEIIVTDSYSLYSLKKGTEMPIEKGDSKFYDTTLKNARERVTKNKEEETKVLDIQQIKDNKKNKSNIDHYSGTKSGVTFIDDIKIDTDKLIDATRILGADLKYSVKDDGMPTLFLKNPDGETALISGIKTYGDDTKPKKDEKLPVKDTRREELKKLELELNNFNEKETKPALPAKELPDTSLQERLSLIKDNFEFYKDTGENDILQTVIKDYKQYLKEGGTGKVPGLDSHMKSDGSLKAPTELKKFMAEKGFNIKLLPKKETKVFETFKKGPSNNIEETMNKLLVEGKIDIRYSPKSNDETVKNAYNIIKEQGENTPTYFFTHKEFTSESVALSSILSQYYSATGQLDQLAAVFEKTKEIGTTGGQLVQAFNIISKTTPEGYMYCISKEIDKINDILRSSKDPILKTWLKENTNGVILEDHEQDSLYSLAEHMMTLNEDDRERYVIQTKIITYVQDKIPKSISDKLLEYRRISLLLNPRTWVKNFLGNFPTLPLNILTEKIVGVPLDKFLAKYSGIRTKGNFSLNKIPKDFLQGMKQSARDFKMGIATTPMNEFERPTGKVFTEDHSSKNVFNKNTLDAVGKLGNTATRIVNFVMDGGDRGFFNVYYEAALNMFKDINGGGPVTETQRELAEEWALKLTWKDSNKLTQLGTSLRRGLNFIRYSNKGFKVLKKYEEGENIGVGLGTILVPFVMTPVNLAIAGYDFSPLSVASVVVAHKEWKEAINSGNEKEKYRSQFKLEERLKYLIIGTLLWSAAALVLSATKKSKNIKITGGYDPKLKKLQQSQGFQPYSLQVGNSYYDYSWSEPLGSMMGVITDIDKKRITKLAEGEKMKLMELLMETLSSVGNSMAEQSYIATVIDFLEGSKYAPADATAPEKLFEMTKSGLESGATQLVPSFIRNLGNFLDNSFKETYEKDNAGKTLSNRLLGNIPGLKSYIPSKKTLFGDTAIRGGTEKGIFTNFFNSFLNPGKISTGIYTKETEELTNIYIATGKTDFLPREVSKKIEYTDPNTKEKQSIVLTAKQRSKLQEKMGKIYHDALLNMMDNNIYNNSTSEEKANILKSLSLYAKDKAVEDLNLFDNFELKSITEAGKIQMYINNGLELSSALLYKGLINEIKPEVDSTNITIPGSLNGKKAKAIMDLNISNNDKNVMLKLINATAKKPETVSNLQGLKTQNDYISYYSLSSAQRETFVASNKHFKISPETFSTFVREVNKFEADYVNGKIVSNSKKNKVINYINSLRLTIPQKIYLTNIAGYSIKEYSNEMFDYINGLPLTRKQKLEIWNSLGFK